ncbi:MotA/TolQ/ExbB proton channel family protein [Paroceanicella profunda]|uniref:MotA/TolQ/ExbB proton channel family protein n=1 Tax=Paroceanicella profunda TaxID=2579971 RepID=A0A5B8FXH3_9RHOB|nr:MotA/TolQ/ExbB proton channel family protein [Paroceanicella profunda]QDL91202.1 MotA/TolQ/ExbB proton channel family protein [Paroceanicella profunda]
MEPETTPSTLPQPPSADSSAGQPVQAPAGAQGPASGPAAPAPAGSAPAAEAPTVAPAPEAAPDAGATPAAQAAPEVPASEASGLPASPEAGGAAQPGPLPSDTAQPGSGALPSGSEGAGALPAGDAVQAGAGQAGDAAQQGLDALAGTPGAGDAVASADPSLVLPGGIDISPVADSLDFIIAGGPAMWAIGALSVLTFALILWKLLRFSVSGIWRRRRAETALALWQDGRDAEALTVARGGHGILTRFVRGTMDRASALPDAAAREQTESHAMDLLHEARSGLRALDLIATIAPLLGLLGTVLGMISAFQALQESGARADPSALAGGIWEALLTTAAGMAVAIPATAAGSWFEAILARTGRDMERTATLVFTRRPPPPRAAHSPVQSRLAAE